MCVIGVRSEFEARLEVEYSIWDCDWDSKLCKLAESWDACDCGCDAVSMSGGALLLGGPVKLAVRASSRVLFTAAATGFAGGGRSSFCIR